MIRFLWLCSLLLWPARWAQAQTPEAAERHTATIDSAAAVHYQVGYRLFQAQSFRSAIPELEQAVAADSAYGDAFYTLGLSYGHLNEYDKAINAIEAAQNREMSAQNLKEGIPSILSSFYQKSAATFFRQNKYQEAIIRYEKSLAINPQDAKAQYSLGVCYSRMRNTEAARRAYAKAIEVDPSYAKAYKALGDLQRQSRNYGPAIEAYQKALALDSTLAEAWGGLARSQIDSQDLEGALKTLRQTLEINTKYQEGYVLLGYVLNQLGRQQDAIAPLRRAVDLEGEDPEAHFRLAEAYYALGDYRNTLRAAQNSLQYKKDNHPAEVTLADTYLKLGQKEQARVWYKKALVDSRFKDYCAHQLEELSKPPPP
ncbi:MAG: tetratricopeptide repeat protein [Candidatus Latescibacteria bacterium]|nr:tetratricopeptide repeat protein [Candidatus Latescibacterota bacterium]